MSNAEVPCVAPAETVRATADARAEHVVDLWCFFYEQRTDRKFLGALAALLNAEERERHDRIRFERDRLMFLATRALVRTALSEYADVMPSEWCFGEGEHGKPFIEGPLGVPRLQFNLTNTRGLVVCAVSTTCTRLGVDAECTDRSGDPMGVAEDYFSGIEVQALRSLPRELQRNRFFRYWTLKESYIKARGLGLALPLDHFTFLLEDDTIRIAFAPQFDDVPERWSFAQLSVSSRHLVAVSATTFGAPLVLRGCHYLPLFGVLPSKLRSNEPLGIDTPSVLFGAT